MIDMPHVAKTSNFMWRTRILVLQFIWEIISCRVLAYKNRSYLNVLMDRFTFASKSMFSVPKNLHNKKEPEIQIYCSRLQWRGGHNRLILKILEIYYDNNISIILTGVAGKSDSSLVDYLRNQHKVSILELSGTIFNRLQKCTCLMSENSNATCLLINSPNDFIGPLAAFCANMNNVTFIHHSDLYVTAGATVDKWVHLDLLIGCNHECKKNLDAKLLSLPSSLPSDFCAKYQPSRSGNKNIVFCASWNKLNLWGKTGFPSVFRDILKNDTVSIHHIGYVPLLIRLYLTCYLWGSNGSYNYVGPVTSLGEELSKKDFDFAIMSFPQGAGMTCIDYLAYGIPVIFFDANGQNMREVINLTDGTNFLCRSSKDITDVILHSREDVLEHVSRNNLAHHVNNYTDKCFKENLDKYLSYHQKSSESSENEKPFSDWKAASFALRHLSLRGVVRYIRNNITLL